MGAAQRPAARAFDALERISIPYFDIHADLGKPVTNRCHDDGSQCVHRRVHRGDTRDRAWRWCCLIGNVPDFHRLS